MSKGLSKVPWKPLGNTGVHYWLVQRMAKQTGLDVAQAQDARQLVQEDWAEMVQTCRSCEETGACHRWLQQNGLVSESEPPGYCLNADILKRLANVQSTSS